MEKRATADAITVVAIYVAMKVVDVVAEDAIKAAISRAVERYRGRGGRAG